MVMKKALHLHTSPHNPHWMDASLKVLPAIASKKIGAGGYMVLRPDSGDPTESVLMVRLRLTIS